MFHFRPKQLAHANTKNFEENPPEKGPPLHKMLITTPRSQNFCSFHHLHPLSSQTPSFITPRLVTREREWGRHSEENAPRKSSRLRSATTRKFHDTLSVTFLCLSIRLERERVAAGDAMVWWPAQQQQQHQQLFVVSSVKVCVTFSRMAKTFFFGDCIWICCSRKYTFFQERIPFFFSEGFFQPGKSSQFFTRWFMHSK